REVVAFLLEDTPLVKSEISTDVYYVGQIGEKVDAIAEKGDIVMIDPHPEKSHNKHKPSMTHTESMRSSLLFSRKALPAAHTSIRGQNTLDDFKRDNTSSTRRQSETPRAVYQRPKRKTSW